MHRTILLFLSLSLLVSSGCVASSSKDGGDKSDIKVETDALPTDVASPKDAEPPTDAASPDGPSIDIPPPQDNGSTEDVAQPVGGCMADHFLELTNAAGAGPGYEAAWVTATCAGDTMVVKSNGMPHYTFVPVTPLGLVAVSTELELPINPTANAQPTDIALLGVTGIAVNGVVFYGPNEAQQPDPYGDPQLNAITDGCWGHTAQAYHYHALRDICLSPDSLQAEPWTNPDPDPAKASPILGFALDGFPVYGPLGCLDAACTQVAKMKSSWEATGFEKMGCSTDADCGNGFQCGKAIVDGDEVNICGSETYAWDHNECTKETCQQAAGEWLDQCNGRFGPDGTYRYHATDTFPYILGCFKGTPATAGPGAGTGPGNGGDPNGPPDGAPQDCQSDADCTDACPDGSKGCGCITLSGGPMAGQQKCVPLCDADADCPAAPNGGDMVCVDGGHCAPAMGGGGPP